MRWAALLKGINIGGKKIPMTDLKALVEKMGHGEVRTLLASGNVVFTATETDGAKLERALEEALAAWGLKTEVVVRAPGGTGLTTSELLSFTKAASVIGDGS